MQGLLCSISVFEYQNACIFHLVMLEATNSAASDRLEELMLAQYDHSTHRNRDHGFDVSPSSKPPSHTALLFNIENLFCCCHFKYVLPKSLFLIGQSICLLNILQTV